MPDAVRELRPRGPCPCGTDLDGLPARAGERRQQIEIPEPKTVVTELSLTPLTPLISSFQPGPDATERDAGLARDRIAAAVAAGQPPESVATAALITPGQLIAPVAEDESPGPRRVYLSGLPASLGLGGGAPRWAHGMESSTETSSLKTAEGLPLWFQRVEPLVQMTVVREGDPAVLLSLPPSAVDPAGLSLEIAAGSVWMASGLFAPEAAGGFAGLRVSGGLLSSDGALTLRGLQLSLPAAATATLTLVLDQTAAPPGAGGPGADEQAASMQAPATATIVLAPDGATLSTKDPSSLMVYGVDINFTPEPNALEYHGDTGDLALPLAADRKIFSPAAVASSTAAPLGSAPVAGGAWAIPVAFTTAENLGPAAGPGALRLLLGAGLTVQIPPLRIAVPLCSAAVSVGSGVLELAGEIAAPVACRVSLWNEQPAPGGATRSSSARFDLRSSDRLLAMQGDGMEIVAINGECSAFVDRPILGGGAPPNLGFPLGSLQSWRPQVTPSLTSWRRRNCKWGAHPIPRSCSKTRCSS